MSDGQHVQAWKIKWGHGIESISPRALHELDKAYIADGDERRTVLFNNELAIMKKYEPS